MLYLRSFIFNIILFVAVFFFSVLGLMVFWLPYEKRYWYLTGWQRSMTWLAEKFCGIRYEIKGWENLPSQPYVIASNHQSTWETLSFFVIFPKLTFVLKKELLQIPIFGWALRLLEPIAINRKQGSNAMEQILQQGRERLAQGRTIVVFPQGKRMPVNQPGAFRVGAAMLAKNTNVPLVPIHHNAGQYWPRRGLIKRPGLITVEIFPAINPANLTVAEIQTQLVACLSKS